MTTIRNGRAPATTAPGPSRPADAGEGSARARAGVGKLARGGALGLVGAAVTAVAGVLVVLVITRSMSKDSAGLFFALTSIFLIAEMVSRLGTGTGLVYALSRARALGRQSDVPGLLRVALTPVVGLSVLMTVVLVASADSLATLLGEGSAEASATAIRVLAVLLPLTTVSDTLIAATRGYGTMRPTVLVDRIGRPLVQLAAVALAVVGGALTAVTVAWAVPWVLSAAVAGWWLRRLLRRERPTTPAQAPAALPWRSFWSFTAPRAVTSVIQLALQRLDIVLLTLLSGPAAAAVYTAATRFLVVGQFVNQALANVVEPQLGRLIALGDRSAANTVYRVATGWLVLLCWPMYLVAGTYADRFLDWFGTGYDSGTPVVVLLAVTMLVATAIGMVDVVLLMAGRARWNLMNSSLALVVFVCLDLLLIPPFGIVGAAIGWAVAILLNNLLPLAQVWRSLGMHPFGRGAAVAVLLAMTCFAALPALRHLLVGDDLLWSLATTVLGVVLYAGGCWHWRAALSLDALSRAGRRPRSTATPAADRSDEGMQ